jgi:membrane protease YdiL (CAAX protease family)
MLEKFRALYKEKLAVKIGTVLLVVFFSIAIMVPLLELAKLFGVNIRENANLDLKVDFANVFFFFLYGSCSIGIIWLAQKYIHQRKLVDLGFKTKVFKLFFLGFIVGVCKIGFEYIILGLNAEEVKFIPTVPANVSLLSYIGYYLYFFFGFIVWNSLIEELSTRAYAIETLKKHVNPHIIFTSVGILFTIGHFIIHDFSVASFISLFITSYIFSLVYYYSNSIWLVIGIHSGLNWFGFSFSGGATNWKLGALVRIEIYDIPTWIYNLSGPMIGILLLLLVIYSNKKGFFKKISA